MTNTRASAAPILTPAQVRTLLLDRIIATSVAGRVCTEVSLTGQPGSRELRIPDVDIDVAQWVGEGQEINVGDATFSETVIVPQALSGGTTITRELWQDSSPAAADAIGKALSRDLARKVDIAFLGSKGTDPNRAPGLLDVTPTTITGGTGWTAGPFIDAVTRAESAGWPLTAWIAHPSTVASLAELLVYGGWTQGGTQTDLSNHYARTLQGVPLLASANVAAGDVFGLCREATLLVIREDATVDADESVLFFSRKIALRSEMRVGFGFLSPDESVYKIELTA